jgi:methyl coenzyme M reductase beta subunit
MKGGVLGQTPEEIADAGANLSPTTNLVLPTLIEVQGITFKQVACGKNHVAAITSNGKL